MEAPLQTEVTRPIVWLLPPPTELDEAKQTQHRISRLGVLADGNNRDGGNYDKGGSNVVEIAEKLLLEDEELRTFLACIVSPENAEKRSETFFDKMRWAFFMLGLRLVLKKNLGGKGIALKYEGNLDSLPSDRGAPEFLAMSRAVQRINDELLRRYREEHPEAPKKELVLGINYSPDVLQKMGIELLYRSGMEESRVGRFGSTQPDESMLVAADETLWPRVTAEHLQALIGKASQSKPNRFKAGYSLEEIESLLKAAAQVVPEDEGIVCIPFDGDPEAIEKLLNPRTHLPFHVEYWNDSLTLRGGASASPWQFVIMDGTSGRKLPPEAVVAPGQTQDTYRLTSPKEMRVNYANVFQSEIDPEAVIQRTQEALRFIRTHASLRGAERNVVSPSSSMEDAVPDRAEFARYKLLKARAFDRQGSLEDEARAWMEETGELNPLTHYNAVADLFVSEMMNWVDGLEMKWAKDVEYRAMFNYLFTSFFLSAAPSRHPAHEGDLPPLVEGWEKGARTVAQYMALVYLMDDRLYDSKFEDPADKKALIDAATSELSKAVRFEALDAKLEDIPNADALRAIAQGFQSLAKELESQSSPELFKAWQECVLNLFHCHREEWSSEVLDNALVEELTAPSEEALSGFEARYSKVKNSPFIQAKVQKAFEKLGSPEEAARQEGRFDLNLWTYLCDIENSIGSALVYRTLACVDSKDVPAEPELSDAYEELCFLINIYFRLANDFAEIYRADDDREENMDSCQLLYKKHRVRQQPEEALIYGAAEVYQLVQEFKREIVEKRRTFQERCAGKKPWEAVARAVTRSDIGELYYKNTHYREARREQVSAFFKELYTLGC